MRRILVYIVSLLTLCACQKESPFVEDKQESVSQKDNNPELTRRPRDFVIISETFDIWDHPRTLNNQCYPEDLDLTGFITYHVQWLQAGDDYYVSYDLDLSNFSALGQTSGLKYSTKRTRYKDIIPQALEAVEYGTILGRKALTIFLKTEAGNTIKINENIFFGLTKAADIYAGFSETIVDCN